MKRTKAEMIHKIWKKLSGMAAVALGLVLCFETVLPSVWAASDGDPVKTESTVSAEEESTELTEEESTELTEEESTELTEEESTELTEEESTELTEEESTEFTEEESTELTEEFTETLPMLGDTMTAAAAADKSTLLKVGKIEVTQEGWAAGAKLDGTKPIHLKYTLSAPVKTDGMGTPPADADVDPDDSATYVAKGDWAVIQFPDNFKLPSGIPDGTTSTILFEGEKLGTIELHTTTSPAEAKIIFSGDIIDTMTDLELEFEQDFMFGKEGSFADTEERVTIDGKDYTITVPKRETVLSGEKKGEVTIAEKTILWTVRVTPELGKVGSGADGNLYGLTFSDELLQHGTDVGDYVTGSFKIGTTDSYDTASVPKDSTMLDYQETVDAGGKTTSKLLTYAFEEDVSDSKKCMGERYVFFKTEIPQKILADGNSQVSNTAEIKDKDGNGVELEQGTLTCGVLVQITRFVKTGERVYEGDVDAQYNPAKDFIVWSFEVNQEKEKLYAATIADELPEELEYVGAATKQVYDERAGDWGRAADMSGKVSADGSNPNKLTIDLCNADTTTDNPYLDEHVLIRIKTRLKDTGEGQHHGYSIANSATLTYGYEGVEGTKDAPSRSGEIEIGNASIVKSDGGYTASTHCAEWHVKVDTRSTPVTDMQTLDLLVYGQETYDWDVLDREGRLAIAQRMPTPTTRSVDPLNVEDLAQLTPNSYQKLTDAAPTVDLDSCSLKFTKYTLSVDGKAVADVLVTTSDAGAGIPTAKAGYTFQTMVTNPALYAANVKDKPIANEVSLFSANTEIGNSAVTQKISSYMVEKDTLNVTDAQKVEGSGATADLAAVNGAAAPGYNYQNNEVVFRISVNANGLADATGDITTVDGEKIGTIPLTDTLPSGWEFKEIVSGKNFLLYKGNKNADGGRVTATAAVADSAYSTIFEGTPGAIAASGSEATLQQTMTFRFKELKEPYVVLVKAGPVDTVRKAYFATNDTTDVSNMATLENDNLKSSGSYPSDAGPVRIQSTVLEKTADTSQLAGQGYVTWTVDYKPYVAGRAESALTDTIPVGAELRITSEGDLDYTSVSVTARTMEADGSYDGTKDDELSAEEMKHWLTYDNATRILKFVPPDSGTAYRITYITDVMAKSGVKLTNDVKLTSGTGGSAESGKEVQVVSMNVSGRMKRVGSLELHKTSEDTTTPLDGAEFTLFVKGKNKVVRTGVSGADGKVLISGIPVGNYDLQETKSPDGYIRQVKRHPVEAKKGSDGNVKVTIDGADTITVVNLPGSGDDAPPAPPADPGSGNSHHGSGGGTPETPKTPEDVTEIVAVPPTEGIPEFVPEYPKQKVPDPNLEESPGVIRLVDDKGNLVGTYTRQAQSDGSYSYVDRYGNRLGRGASVVRTGDSMPVAAVVTVTALALLGAVLLILWKKGRFSKYYDK